jgi:hypothetical protein
MSSNEFRKRNHFVSEVYLKSWSSSDGRVKTYTLLVPHPKVPLWKPASPSGIAFHRHLYTRLVANNESDAIERWLDHEFESPAGEPLKKATSDARLTPDDWRVLVRFLACQDVRTPAAFAERMERWNSSLPRLIEENLRKAVEALQTKQPLGNPKHTVVAPLPVRTIINPGDSSGEGQIGAEILAGRELWLWSINLALSKTINILHKHKWTILSPASGLTWFTSDNPVVRLNYRSSTNYTFGGGWGSKGTEIFMPLGPRHLMYTQIGHIPPRRGTKMSKAQTEIVRRFIAEHADRRIFALNCDADIPTLRQRIVDADLFNSERKRWEKWHEQQTAAEREIKGWK